MEPAGRAFAVRRRLCQKLVNAVAQVRRLASQWHEDGVSTLSAARERMQDADQSAKKGAKKKDARALRYSQRSYSDDDLKHILVDFMDDDA